jgi:tripartite-type tricarboxylate transporter receptor subunit TctC
MVNRGLAAGSVADVVALVKARPGELNCGSAGVGSSAHLAVELFQSRRNGTAAGLTLSSQS